MFLSKNASFKGVTRGARRAQFPGRRITMGAPKNTKNVASTFFVTLNLLPKSSGSNMGAPNLLLAPGAI